MPSSAKSPMPTTHNHQGELRVRPPVALPVMLMAGGVAAAFVFGALVEYSDPVWRTRAAAVPLVIAFGGWLMMVFRSQLRIDPASRRYWWHPSFPWQSAISDGDLDADAAGIVVARTPCAGKRQCTSGYGVSIRFRNEVGEVELARRYVREDADAEGERLSQLLGLPILKV